MTHEMKLKDVYFKKINSGEKIYEIRLNDEKRKLIHIGDKIIFKKQPELKEKIDKVVKNLIYFKSFEEMANNLSLEEIGFKNYTIEEVVAVYRQFYNTQDETKYGIVAIELQK